jgi:hypothetical protein
MTLINDNTEFVETVAAAPEGLRSLFVFTSAKGRDGVVLDKASVSELIEEYGTPNFKLFGQPQYNAYAFLSGGQTKAWCLRVMPSDAAYSNLVLVAKVKVNTTDPANPKMVVRFEALQHVGLNDKEDLAALTELMTVTTPDVDGYRTYPLVAFNSLGRGAYGDALRIRITGATQADKENGFRNYRFEVLELENTVSRKEVFTGTVFPDAVSGMNSLFISDVVADVDTGSNKLGIHVVEENFTALYDIYKSQVRPTTTITEEQFSILTGLNIDNSAIDGLTYDTANNAHVSLDTPEGIPLAGGTDGAFTYDTATLADRETAINNAYAAAFRGDIDRAVLSKRRTPSELIFDAGYADEVKRELVSLLTKRYDAFGFIDGGILNTTTDAIAWGETMTGLSDRVFSKEFQHFKIRDPFSGKAIPVTMTYLFARVLPAHFAGPGNHIPFVGEAYASLTGAIKNTLKPVVDADDMDVKEELYNLRLNYFQALAENTFVRGTQTTSQNIWSDLSEENNMHVLLEMKRRIEQMVSGLAYNFADAEERARFTEDANRVFEGFAGTKVREATIAFDMNAWEEERSIIHCYMGVTFRTMAKRAVVEIDINKRV